MTDFEKYAVSKGISTSRLNGYSGIYNGWVSPNIIETREDNIVCLDVFSKLIQERIIFLGSDIDSDVANIINAQLLYLDSIGDDEITLMINSGGGEIYSGESIIDTMNYISSPVITQCVGMAASMAAVILACGESGKRYALPHSRIMIHQPLSGVPGHTQASDIEINCREVLKLKDELCGMLASASGKSLEEVINDCDRDHWLTSSEALPGAYGPKGLIDYIITKK